MPPNRSVKVTTPKGNDTEPMISGTGWGPDGERGAIFGAAAGLGRDIAAGGDLALADLAGAHPERLDRAGHRRFGQLAAGGQPLAKPHDAGERVDDAKAAARRAGDQQPAIVGAEIERG